jgi:hypothetical protein
MTEGVYTVRGARVNVVKVWRVDGHRFHLHRPVERDGQRRRQGWQLSSQGVPMAAFVDTEQAEIVAYCARMLEVAKLARADFGAAIADRLKADKAGAELTPRVPE